MSLKSAIENTTRQYKSDTSHLKGKQLSFVLSLHKSIDTAIYKYAKNKMSITRHGGGYIAFVATKFCVNGENKYFELIEFKRFKKEWIVCEYNNRWVSDPYESLESAKRAFGL